NPISSGKKSLSYALTFQAEDRSLTEDEVRTIYQRIQQHAAAELGAQPRQASTASTERGHMPGRALAP
ncbi:MAG: hypothetical protein O7G88_07500, partial [bacterium]|nr:hypothetical protein [bacterium]